MGGLEKWRQSKKVNCMTVIHLVKNKNTKESSPAKDAEAISTVKTSEKCETSNKSSTVSETKQEVVSQKKPGLLSMVRCFAWKRTKLCEFEIFTDVMQRTR